MDGQEYKWYKIAASGEWVAGEEEIIELSLPHRKVCVTRWKDKLYAFAQKCPHAGGYLSDGCIDQRGNIECPVHRYKFNIQNGYNSSGEGYYLSTYPVESRADGIYIGFKKQSSLWDLFKK